jgi:hypothetical protein
VSCGAEARPEILIEILSHGYSREGVTRASAKDDIGRYAYSPVVKPEPTDHWQRTREHFFMDLLEGAGTG